MQFFQLKHRKSQAPEGVHRLHFRFAFINLAVLLKFSLLPRTLLARNRIAPPRRAPPLRHWKEGEREKRNTILVNEVQFARDKDPVLT